MAYDDKVFYYVLGAIVLFIVLCWFGGNKFHTYRVNKYNNEVKNKLKNATKYLFGEIYTAFFEDSSICIPYRHRYNLYAKTIFIDKKDVKKMLSFADHVYKKYNCSYTSNIWFMGEDIARFARLYKSLDDYLYNLGINNSNTMNIIKNKHKDEIIEIEKKKLFNM